MRNFLFLLFFLGLTSLESCLSQDNKNTFGKYYRIGEYDILAPFAEQPHISPKQENEFVTFISYQYAYPKIGDDLNNLYGIDVIKIKVDTAFHSLDTKVNFVEGMMKVVFETMLKGKVINEEKGNYRGSYCIRLKVKININNVGEVFMNSIFVPFDRFVLRMYAFTPIGNDGNRRINDFFDSVKYK